MKKRPRERESKEYSFGKFVSVFIFVVVIWLWSVHCSAKRAAYNISWLRDCYLFDMWWCELVFAKCMIVAQFASWYIRSALFAHSLNHSLPYISFFRFSFKTSKYGSNAGFQCRFHFQWPYNRCLAFKHAHNKITMRNINPIESITFIHFDMQLGHRAQCIPLNEYKLREWHSEGVSIALSDLCAMPFCAVLVLCTVSNVYFKYAH